MMSGSRKNRPSRPFALLLLLGAVAFAAGCSTAESPNGSGTVTNHILPSGSSVAGWLVLPSGGSHAGTATLDYIAGGGDSGCTQCHGSDLTGGISRVSCFDNPAGCHHDPVANWATPAVHGATAKQAPGSSGFASCQICHGNDFSGGGAGVACADCHVVNAPHPAQPWRGSTFTHSNTDAKNAPVCAACHFPGSPNNPADHPATPAPAGTPPGCFNSTLCHGDTATAPHPVPFNDPVHYDTTSATFPGTTFPPGCITCHDVSAPSTKVGPVCQTCHVAASPLTSLDCTSCHAAPPDGAAPAGAVYANIPGAHATHIALTGAETPISCDTCHDGLGTGTLNHYNRAKSRVAPGDVAFPATYDAQTGASSFDNSAALNCSNVSCHGGQATPGWRTGAIDVDTQCSNCHAQGTAQFNSYNSGEHQFHVGGLGLLCTFCHNTTTLAVDHFTALATSAMEGPASATIGGGSTIIPAGDYDPATQSCSPDTGVCHGTRTW